MALRARGSVSRALNRANLSRDEAVKIFLNILALLGGIGGSVLVANVDLGLSHYGYIVFTIGAVAAVLLQVGEKTQRGLMLLNMYYIAVNIYGLSERFTMF